MLELMLLAKVIASVTSLLVVIPRKAQRKALLPLTEDAGTESSSTQNRDEASGETA